MKHGEVITIRVNPDDVMTAIDIVDMSPLGTKYGMSLAMVVKWAMHYAFDALRQQGVVQPRDGFEYGEMVKRFKQGNANPLTKGERANTSIVLGNFESHMEATDARLVNPVIQDAPTGMEDSGLVLPPEVKRMVPCGNQDVGIISRRLLAHDENITVEEVAKWLLYSPARSAATTIVPTDLLREAEVLICSIWREYPSVLDY